MAIYALSDGLVDLAAQGINLALRMGALRDSTLVARRLVDNRAAFSPRTPTSPSGARPPP